MKVFLTAAALIILLAASPSFAQTQTPPPAAPAATSAAPPAQAVAPAAPQPPRPFPEGAKIAYLNIQRIASESIEGRASSSRVQALIQKKQTDGADKNKQLQTAQQKLQTGGSVLSDAARAQLEKDIEKYQVDAQRFQQDAQAEINDLQQELQGAFQQKLLPIIQKVVQEKGIQILFSQADAGIVWADGGLDLTGEVIKKFDEAGAATPKTPPPAPKKPGLL